MAGDYEYFAAQGHHPAAYALAELVDNSLRATKGNGGRARRITVTLAVPERDRDRAAGALICVRDNGCGMDKRELNDWAVMNLSMEDRGLLQQ
jgi:DNA mismatch repair ATPase MutL